MEQAGFPLNAAMHVQFIQTCIRMEDYSKASDQFSRLKLCPGLSIDTLLPLIDSYAERGLWKQAEEIFHFSAELGLGRNTLLCNVMIKAYGVGKMYQKAYRLFENMNSEGITPNESTFNTMIHAASICATIEKTVSLFSQMREAGFKPSISSYTAVLSLYSKSHQLKESENIFQEMKVSHSHLDEVAYTAMINAYVNVGMQKEAETTLQDMEAEGHVTSSIAYCLMMKLYGKLDMLDKAEEMFRKIQCMELQPNVHAWNILLHIYGMSGMTNTARVSFKKMQKGRYIDKASCKTIINILRKAGRTQEAFSVARIMQEMCLLSSVSSFNTVIDLYASYGKHDQALDLLKKMIKKGCWPNLQTYFCLKDVLENSGLLKEAVLKLKLVREQENHGIHRLVAIATLYCFVGMQTEAMEECAKLKERSVALDIAAYNTILHVYGANGRFHDAVNIFMKLQTNGPSPNVVTFTTMLLLYGKAGLVGDVVKLFSSMKQSCQPDEACFKAVINIYRRARRFDLANMAAHEMRFVQFLLSGRESKVVEQER
jgi:pentatricopeptide repeat protein